MAAAVAITGLTTNAVICDEAVLEQPFAVAVTVYVVLLAGFAITDAPVVALRPAEGVQVYEVALPLAVSVVPVPPIQTVSALGVTFTVGNAAMVSVVVAVALPGVTVRVMV